MALIYITGIAGSGKSEVLKELKKRGYKAYGTDEDGISAYFNNETNEILENPPQEAKDRTPEWRTRFTWKMRQDLIKELKNESRDKDVYVIGVGANGWPQDEVWDYFDVRNGISDRR